MPYDNTVRVSATFNEVGLITPVVSNQPEVLVLGPSSSGRSYEKYFVGSIGQAEKEFGRTSPMLRAAHEAFAEGADNISVMRVGGRPGNIVITAGTGTLTITPWDRGDDILDRYVLILDATQERVLLYDVVDRFWVYDSEEIYVIDDGVVDVYADAAFDFAALDLHEAIDYTNIAGAVAAGTAKVLSDLLKPDFTPAADDLVITQGDDGLSTSLIEKYAALAGGYHLLNFRDADIVIPTDVYIDDLNIARTAAPSVYGYFWPGRTDSVIANGVPAAGGANDYLGWVAHYLYEGKLYTFFSDVATGFTDFGAGVAASSAQFNDLTLTVQADFEGKGGNANTFTYVVGASGPTATVTPNANGGVDIVVTDDGVAEDDAVATAINAALVGVLLPDGTTYDEVVVAAGSAGTPIGAVAVPLEDFTGGTGGHLVLHNRLTGEDIPSALLATIVADATDTWLRETSFDYQLATFCHLASTAWSAMIGTISTKRPPGVSRSQLAGWVGSLPEYEGNGLVQWVPSSGNGSGLLGLKLYAGEAGFRGHVPEGAPASAGAYGGGLIATKGAGLPTVGGSLGSGFPYGISDGDEDLDVNGFPVDIGKYLIPTFDWPVLATGYGGGTRYRGSFAAGLGGLLARLPVNKLPIGQFGRTRSARGVLKIHPTQLDALSKIRLTGIKPDDTFGTTLISPSTAANPVSDYAMISTVRSVAAVVNGIRAICKPFLGRPFSPSVIASLQQDVDEYIASVRGGENGLHEGALAQLTFTRREKILGHLNINLRIVPPFGIRDINIATSLAADESEL